MSRLATKFESAKQDWATPADVFGPLNDEFHFTLDCAASAENAKCPVFFSAEQDGMLQDWGKEICWLNPPYGEKGKYSLERWLRKAFQAARKGATVVLLIPARTNTNWFHDICLAHCEVRFVRGRPKFGGAPHGLPQPLAIIIMRPHEVDLDAVPQIAAEALWG